jgi:hypothetical protein
LAPSDFLNMQADALVGMAEVLRLAGKQDEARGTLGRAIERYELKGKHRRLEPTPYSTRPRSPPERFTFAKSAYLGPVLSATLVT